MKVSDMRIGVKLGAGFLLMVLLTTLLGGMALMQMSRIQTNADNLASELLPKVAQVGELRVLLNRMRRAEAGLATARNAAEVKAFAEQVQARAKDIERVEAALDPLLDTGAERDVLARYKERKAKYLKLQVDLVEVARNVDFSTTETHELTGDALGMLYAGESETAFVATADTLGEMQKINTENAAQASADARSVFGAARVWLVGTLAACVLAAALLGVGISRAVTVPARHAVEAARSFAAGDLSVQVPAGGRDEMG